MRASVVRDIIGDADGKRYAVTLSALLSDSGCDAILVVNLPTALASPSDAAREIVAAIPCVVAAIPSRSGCNPVPRRTRLRLA